MNSEIYILGDLNINYLPNKGVDKFNNKRWESLMQKFGLTQIVNLPTRITKSTSTIIDHIYTARRELVYNVNVPKYAVSDHFPICFTRLSKSLKIKSNKHESIKYRSFKSFNEIDFRNCLATSHLEQIITYNNPNEALNVFYNILNTTLCKHAPIKEKRIKHYTQPEWFNADIKEAMHKRDKLLNQRQFDDYKIMRNKVTAMIKKSKKSFYNNAIKANKNPSYLWNTLKTISNSDSTPKAGIQLPNFLEVNNITIEGTANILDALNEQFTNISNIIEKNRLLKIIFQNFKVIWILNYSLNILMLNA